jgi:NAD(P)-dependent dehydrogenase (short-subunit alcohol dehydrogenase family)
MVQQALSRTADQQRNTLVTGGSNGIGRAVVRRFVRSGDNVWFTYLSGRDRADALLAEMRELDSDSEIRAFEFSQGDRAGHENLIASLPGPVDVLINNSAIGSKTAEQYVPGPQYLRDEAFLQVNGVGPLWLLQALVPGMLERGYGKVVNVSSVGGGVGVFPGMQIADGMSKAALAYMTRHAAAELAHEAVDVFAVCPGAVDTPMFRASTLDSLTPERRQAVIDDLPAGRLIEPEEIAELIWWLCGAPARVLHGAVIDASMGLGVHPGLLRHEPAPEARPEPSTALPVRSF